MKAPLWIAGIAMLLAATAASATVTKAPWGEANGKHVDIYTITDGDITVRITNYGGHIVSIDTPGRNGKMEDIVLGYDSVAKYLTDKTFFGSTIGRYGNRIAKGTFSIDGHTYHVPPNDGANALHGGAEGFNTKIWTARELPNGVEMTLVSPDGDMGFPGTLTAHVRFTLEGKSLRMEYTATTTKPTLVNLTNHSYFNLNGNGKGTILNELLTIDADRYTPVDKGLIPTGQLAPVAGTPFDFRKPTPVGAHIHDPSEQLKYGHGGYDQNFVLNNPGPGMHLAAKLYDPANGRTLTITTTEPGVQFYSGNNLDGSVTGMFGVAYPQYAGMALETQHFPDSPNEPSFPSTLLKPGQTYHTTTVFTFGVKQ